MNEPDTELAVETINELRSRDEMHDAVVATLRPLRVLLWMWVAAIVLWLIGAGVVWLAVLAGVAAQ